MIPTPDAVIAAACFGTAFGTAVGWLGGRRGRFTKTEIRNAAKTYAALGTLAPNHPTLRTYSEQLYVVPRRPRGSVWIVPNDWPTIDIPLEERA